VATGETGSPGPYGQPGEKGVSGEDGISGSRVSFSFYLTCFYFISKTKNEKHFEFGDDRCFVNGISLRFIYLVLFLL